MSAIFRSKLFESKSGYFADSISIGVKHPSESLHISGGNLRIDDGSAFFSNRPLVSGVPVMVSGDFNSNLENLYTDMYNMQNNSFMYAIALG